MNQEAFFAVSDYITASLSTVQLVAHMQKALDDLAARGIGMIHTVSGVGFARDLDVDLERFFCARHHKRHADARVYADARCE